MLFHFCGNEGTVTIMSYVAHYLIIHKILFQLYDNLSERTLALTCHPLPLTSLSDLSEGYTIFQENCAKLYEQRYM